MDKGTELDFVQATHARYGVGPIKHTSLGEHDPEWDVLYPVSSFLDTYRFKLPSTPFDWPNLKYTANESATDGVRRIQMSFGFVSEEVYTGSEGIDRTHLAGTGVRRGDLGMVL